MCGISVVKDWEKLKRFNLEQIQQSGIEEERVIASPNVAKDPAPKPDGAGVQKEAKLDVSKTKTEEQEDPGELALFSAVAAPVTTPPELKAGNQNGGTSEENPAAGTENAT